MKMYIRNLMPMLVLASTLVMSGCANFYVDTSTPLIPKEQFNQPESPQPVYVVVEFQTDGTTNANATKTVKPIVIDNIKNSGLFSEVLETARDDARLLTVKINNVPLDNDAFSNGFVTGFTYGLVGSEVSDGYVCKATLTVDGVPAPLVAKSRHAIHTTLGAKGAPDNGVKVKNLDAAITMVIEQLLSHVFNDLSHQEQF